MKPTGIQYKILERSQEKVLLEINFSTSFEYFEGHFEEFKLLAALIQIKVSIDFFNEFFPIELSPTSIPKMKFSNPIKPDHDLMLELHLNQEKKVASFKYFDSKKIYSLGDIHL